LLPVFLFCLPVRDLPGAFFLHFSGPHPGVLSLSENFLRGVSLRVSRLPAVLSPGAGHLL